MIQDDHELLLREGVKIAQALGKMFAPLVEVVLHDLTNSNQSIVHIENNLSGRKVGDATTEIGLARQQDPDFPDILQNYVNRFPDGRPAKSTSIGLRDKNGRYVAALCLNMDVSLMGGAVANLIQFLQTDSTLTPVETLSPVKSLDIEQAIQQFASSQNTIPRHLTLGQRRLIVGQLVDQGVLDIKQGISTIAHVFGVARSTVYTYIPKKES